MLQPATLPPAPAVQGFRFAIVASRYNARFVDAMLEAASGAIHRAGGTLEVVRVPGAFEIPVVAAALVARTRNRPAAVICLGVILRGETTHAQHIGEAVSVALAQIQIQTRVPMIHEVLLLENEAQAERRCLDPQHNRGLEAAATAMEMGILLSQLTFRPTEVRAAGESGPE
jgi:6,7-dimethyl-8-ribityllumazine synthase